MPTSPPKLRNRHLFHAIIYFEWVLSQICALLPCISHYEPKNEMAQFSLCSSFLKLSHHHDTIPCKKTAHAHSYLTKRHTLALVSVAKSISLLILPSASQLVLWVVWTSLLWSSQVKWRCTQFPTYRVTHSCGCGGNFREPWAGGDKWVLPWVGVSWAFSLVGVSSVSPASLETAPRLRPGSAYAQSVYIRALFHREGYPSKVTLLVGWKIPPLGFS